MKKITTILALLAMVICGSAKTETNESMVTYKKVQVEDCKGRSVRTTVFYREAGCKDKWSNRKPNAEIHFVSSGHFALESHHTEIARLMKEFLNKQINRNLDNFII